MKVTRGSGEGHDNTESKLTSIRADLIRTGSRLLRTQSSTSLAFFLSYYSDRFYFLIFKQ